ncbi:hypothetical protein [Candidatus Tisiphia endosymbiont of Sialis lutaria]|uniref:hypothetical protein n=1 Tax=Candidatus Tisiphia endosymbiont of Sialis lutaria TaxID=2029164 RepID=UPI00312C9BFF
MPRCYITVKPLASRDNEQAVVVIKCLENYDRNNHHGELWKAIETVHYKRGVHSITMPWQMFGNQCRNSDNTENIEDNDLTVIANNNLAMPQTAVARRPVGGGGEA